MRFKTGKDVTKLTENTEAPNKKLPDAEAPEAAEAAVTEPTEPGEPEHPEDTPPSETQQAPEEAGTDAEPDPKSGPPRKPVSTRRLAVYLLIKIAVILLVLWLTFTFVLGITIHEDNNMHPSIRNGDLVVSLRLQPPYLNAAVLYRHNGKTTVGRVVGLSGNVIDISDNGELLVDGSIAAEEIYFPTEKADQSAIRFPYTVENGKAFILNDFREDTNDSRSFGAVDLHDIDGPILFMLRRRGF